MENLYDVIIVGGGPAGLSAAIYMARAKYRVLVLEKAEIGGQITITSEIVNYPGVERTSGRELTGRMRRQAESFGAEFALAEVLEMELQAQMKRLHTTKGTYQSLGVILAPGANPRKLGFKGEREFQGRGVAYCATCDGEFFTGMQVFVIGGGFAAVEEGLFLTKYARKVTFVVRRNEFSCARTVSDQLKGHEKIEVLFETELLEVGGEGMVSYGIFCNRRTGETWRVDAGEDGGFGVFVFAGYVPNTNWIGLEVERDEQGYLLTDRDQKTSVEGVYAAGDVCVKNLRQVVTAVSDGAVAATALERVVSELRMRLGIPELTAQRQPKSQSGNRSNDTHQEPVAGEAQNAVSQDAPNSGNEFFTDGIRQQLVGVFARFQQKIILKAWLDDSPLSGEIRGFLRELDALTDRVEWLEPEQKEEDQPILLPSIEVCRADGSSSGIQFHGVPGGHEFNSFIIALYNVAGPGQQLAPEVEQELRAISEKKNLKILVSLSCTMCPETVMAAQKAAALNENVEAEMFDLAHFPALKKKYQVMSVPCLILNDEKVFFGKKTAAEIAGILRA